MKKALDYVSDCQLESACKNVKKLVRQITDELRRGSNRYLLEEMRSMYRK